MAFGAFTRFLLSSLPEWVPDPSGMRCYFVTAPSTRRPSMKPPAPFHHRQGRSDPHYRLTYSSRCDLLDQARLCPFLFTGEAMYRLNTHLAAPPLLNLFSSRVPSSRPGGDSETQSGHSRIAARSLRIFLASPLNTTLPLNSPPHLKSLHKSRSSPPLFFRKVPPLRIPKRGGGSPHYVFLGTVFPFMLTFPPLHYASGSRTPRERRFF